MGALQVWNKAIFYYLIIGSEVEAPSDNTLISIFSMDSLGRTQSLFHRQTTRGGIHDIIPGEVSRVFGPGPSYIRDELTNYQKSRVYSQPAGVLSITPNVSL